MADTIITEMNDSREMSGGSCTFHYHVEGTDDDTQILADLLAGTPTTYGSLIREDNPTIEPIWVRSYPAFPPAAQGQWDCHVRYNPPGSRSLSLSDIGTVRITGSTTGGSAHVQASLSTVGAYGSGASTGDNGNLVGVTKDGVDGADVAVPVFEFSVAKIFSSGSLPNLGTIYGLSGRTNNAGVTFTDSESGVSLTFLAGECLLLGVDFGTERDDGGIEFTYKFAASPNLTGLSVGSIGGIAKAGWEYLWVRYDQAEIGGLKILGNIPKAVYVEQMYYSGNFTGLGI